MKNVQWNRLLSDYQIYNGLTNFVVGAESLRNMRKVVPTGTPARSEIYKLEKMGIRRAKNATRKALSRIGRVS